MEDEAVIRQQMDETRNSLTEKLETLEQKVVDTVEDTTSAVKETVETVKDSIEETVTAVKDTVAETVDTVKESMREGVETVKSWFDVPDLVDRHPWAMMAGSVATGFCLERTFLPAASKAAAHKEETEAESHFPSAKTARTPHHMNGGRKEHKERHKKASWLHDLGPEIDKLKGLALGALIGLGREMLLRAAPEHLGQQLAEVVDNITRKLGGQPLPGADLEQLQPAHAGSEKESNGREARRF